MMLLDSPEWGVVPRMYYMSSIAGKPSLICAYVNFFVCPPPSSLFGCVYWGGAGL